MWTSRGIWRSRLRWSETVGLATVLIYVFVLVLIGLIALLWFWEWRRKRPVRDPAEGTPYTIYTTEFDRVVAAEKLSEKLVSFSLDYSKGFLSRDQWEWEKAIESAEKILGTLSDPTPQFAPLLKPSENMAVTLLVDQSGSMKGQPMANAAAGLRKLTEILRDKDIKTEVIGFTTAGWHGGFVRQKWVDSRRPPRPGRLCAVLHIIYKSFDEAEFSENAWREMLNPDVLRENVDGEAIKFAEARLLERPETRRILLVISDGAPVDDSTLIQNGPSFLYRHLTETISDIQKECNIQLCGIGINHNVDELYGSSASADDGQSLVHAALGLVGASKPPTPE